MIREGNTVLFQFPQTDRATNKLRPALVIRKLPGHFDDWLICMISSQISYKIPDFDEVINSDDSDYQSSGLKNTSIIRIGRLAVVNQSILLGSIGEIDYNRLIRIKSNLAKWLRSSEIE